jgi:glycerol-3-phosphate cytidylyltransferase-like family protein
MKTTIDNRTEPSPVFPDFVDNLEGKGIFLGQDIEKLSNSDLRKALEWMGRNMLFERQREMLSKWPSTDPKYIPTTNAARN